LIDEFQPASLLAIGETASALGRRDQAGHSVELFDAIGADEILGRVDTVAVYDLIVVADVLERLEKEQAQVLVSRLRDLHCKRLIVLVPAKLLGKGRGWDRNEFLGLGMEEVFTCEREGQELCAFKYDINTYKTTPDWLNAKYWAHPELFDKYWW
ncbi:MAG: hypothetical protein GWO39_04710, partial [Gammaproteobacteria bacterium]|nr:hypothetical protein [Gammaproteobacteria bacterium]NIY31684.1 hypothetical protein [Gammaproteobacteria bacterium]